MVRQQKDDGKREALKQLYPNRSWALKVDNMTDQQVVAIYLRLNRQGAFKKAA